MRRESAGQQYSDGSLTTSSAGAMGLMQVIPATYEQLRAQAATRRLRAVRTGRFATLPEDASVAGPQAGQALAQIARILHPDASG